MQSYLWYAIYQNCQVLRAKHIHLLNISRFFKSEFLKQELVFRAEKNFTPLLQQLFTCSYILLLISYLHSLLHCSRTACSFFPKNILHPVFGLHSLPLCLWLPVSNSIVCQSAELLSLLVNFPDHCNLFWWIYQATFFTFAVLPFTPDVHPTFLRLLDWPGF